MAINLTIDFDSDREKLGLYRTLKALKGRHRVEIKKYREKRSTPQLKYYWGVIVQTLALEFGYTPQEMHFVLKRQFLTYPKPNRITGEEEWFIGSTKDLDTAQAEAFYEQVRVWSLTEFSILIPLPNEI